LVAAVTTIMPPASKTFEHDFFRGTTHENTPRDPRASSRPDVPELGNTPLFAISSYFQWNDSVEHCQSIMRQPFTRY
jgi:hypothetical protein